MRMRKFVWIGLLSVILAGCSNIAQSVIIDWVDFVKFNDTVYTSSYSKELASEQYLGEVVSTVKFKLDENVTNTSYKTKNGDSAYLEEGTKIYKVIGAEGVYAVKDAQNTINGYKIYEENGDSHFEKVAQSDIHKIEIHEMLPIGGYSLVKSLENKAAIQSFLTLLNASKVDLNFEPHYENQDPLYFSVLFYHDGPIVDNYMICFDGTTYYWYPFETAILTEEMATYLR